MNYHQIILLGNTTRDAESFQTKKNKNFTKFTIAVNEYKGKDTESKVFFYDVLVFGKTAEKALEKIKKGDLITVYGKPDYEAYISKKDNEAKASVTVVADSWTVLK